MVVILALLHNETYSLPIDNSTSINQLFHNINEIVKKDANNNLNNQNISASGNSQQQQIENLNKEKNSNDSVINVEYFSTLPDLNLNFSQNPHLLDDKNVSTEFFNGTFSEIKVNENHGTTVKPDGEEKMERSTNKKRKVKIDDDEDDHGLICSSGELQAYLATTEIYDSSSENDGSTTSVKDTITESNVMKIAAEKSDAEKNANVSSVTTQKIAVVDTSNTTESSTSKITSISTSTEQYSASSSTTYLNEASDISTDSTTSSPSSNTSNPEEEKGKLMAQIAEVSAVPVILTQGV